MKNIKEYGIIGDGVHDDSEGLQKLLDSGESELYIPQGCYLVSKTLKIHSNTKLTLNPNARLIMDGSVKKRRGDFLISNADLENGNENIEICGGVWDGNNQGEGNQKPDLFDKNGYSGAVMNFFNIKGLTLRDLVVANSVTFNIRLCTIENFEIENISFLSDCFGRNQDGIHFGGKIRNGVVRNIRALSKGQTNDDMIALNADDSIERVENLDLCRDYIENVTFENIFAEDCLTIIRILSIDAVIKNVHIKNVYGGYRGYAINADAARYCLTPLFNDDDRPQGVGRIENFTVENMTVYSTNKECDRPAICCESNMNNVQIKDFKFIQRNGVPKPSNALHIRNVVNQKYNVDGNIMEINNKEQEVFVKDFTNLEITQN